MGVVIRNYSLGVWSVPTFHFEKLATMLYILNICNLNNKIRLF